MILADLKIEKRVLIADLKIGKRVLLADLKIGKRVLHVLPDLKIGKRVLLADIKPRCSISVLNSVDGQMFLKQSLLKLFFCVEI